MISGMHPPLTINKKGWPLYIRTRGEGGNAPLQFIFRKWLKPMSICFPNIPLVFTFTLLFLVKF